MAVLLGWLGSPSSLALVPSCCYSFASQPRSLACCSWYPAPRSLHSFQIFSTLVTVYFPHHLLTSVLSSKAKTSQLLTWSVPSFFLLIPSGGPLLGFCPKSSPLNFMSCLENICELFMIARHNSCLRQIRADHYLACSGIWDQMLMQAVGADGAHFESLLVVLEDLEVSASKSGRAGGA